jgi:hypothetical protein
MTKPVAAFRSRVIGDSKHTVRFDEKSHLVLFPSFSRYITSCTTGGISPQDIPALFGGPFHVQLGEWVFVRWIGPLE